MGRLIDADVLIDKLKRTSAFGCVRNAADKNVFEIIEEQPTAYDVSKIVAELENLENSKARCRNLVEIGKYQAYKKVIDIVRKGGVE